MAIDRFKVILDQHIRSAVGLPDFRYDATIIVGSHQVKAIAVLSVTNRQDYINNMFEEIIVSVAVQPSEYTEVILNGHEDMRVVLAKSPYEGGQVVNKTYRGILTSHKDGKLEGNIKDVGDTGILDRTSVSIVHLQLIDPATFDLRLRELGGIFRDATAIDVLRYYLGNLTLTDIYSKDDFVASVTVDENTITKQHKQIQVPEGTDLVAAPDYLQSRYGIYNQGLGCFLKSRCWYVFSPYSLVKFGMDVDKLTILNAPPANYRTLERNFTVVGKMITIAATGETRHIKKSDAEALNGGTGVRYGDVAKLMDTSTADPADTLPSTKPEDYVTEYRSSNYAASYNRVRTSDQRFISNPAVPASELARRGGDIVEVVWENGEMGLLLPGMPVRFLYGKDNTFKEKQGTLLGAEMHSSIPLAGFIEPRHRNNIKLTVFLKNA